MATLLKFKRPNTIKIHTSCINELIKYTDRFGHLYISRFSKVIDQVHLGGVKTEFYETYNELTIKLSNNQLVSISGDLIDKFLLGHVLYRDSFAMYSFLTSSNPLFHTEVEVLAI